MSANNSEFTQPNNLFLNENIARCGIIAENRNENNESTISTISGHSTLSGIDATEIRPIQRRRRKVIKIPFWGCP